MKVYLSGKMTGLAEKEIWNNFRKVEIWLSDKKRFDTIESIINPAVTYAMQNIKAFSYEDWLRVDFAMLDACDAVFLLPNWEDSMGAKLEIAYAFKHGKEVFYPRCSSAPKHKQNKKFRFNKEKYNIFEVNPELTKRVTLEVEKYKIKKSAENLLDSIVENIAVRNLTKEIED